MTDEVLSRVNRPTLADLVAWAAFALAALAILWPLGLTNRVLAGVDAFTYFAPYWDYRMAALRAGQIPLWNPYLFLGVPFLANPQAAVLYPLHWPLSWLTAEQALAWSALLHAWLAAGFTYTLARRSFRLSRLGAWLAGLIFGLGGFALARAGNINQLNALTWLPAMLWLYDEAAAARDWRRGLRWGSGLAVAIALCLLAGHTQSFFVNMVGLGVYAAASILQRCHAERVYGARPVAANGQRSISLTNRDSSLPLVAQNDTAVARRERHGGRDSSLPLVAQNDTWARLWPLLAVIPAILLAAAQLLPTLELNDLGLRTGGLPYRQAVSFSLHPRLLAQTFLPPFGGELGQAFDSEGYAEFVGYIGIVGLALAGVAIRRGLRSHSRAATAAVTPAAIMLNGSTAQRQLPQVTSEAPPSPKTPLPLPANPRPVGYGPPLGLAAAGIFLALGAYNPIYYLLWRFVPGFDLFRAPARWLALFALGAAVLAGIGLDGLKTTKSTKVDLAKVAAVSTAGLLLIALALQQLPPPVTLAGWLAAGLAVAALLGLSRRWPALARGGLVALALVELGLGGRALPFAQATAPQAAGLRNAPAALLAATADQPPAGRDRFLSLSDIRYDPGDLAELRALQAGRLPDEAVELLVRAAKQVEVVAPNLPLRLRLPAVDGYDGGVLPLGRYVDLQSLFLPSGQLIPDGRLREQLAQIPPDRLLDLTGVRFVITDKQRDLWADDIYYDLEQAAPLAPGQTLTLDLTAYPAFSATAIGAIIERLESDPAAGAGELIVTTATGEQVRLTLAFGPEAATESPTPTLLQLPRTLAPAALAVSNTGQETWALRGLSLVDARTAAHASVTVSPRGNFRRIHTGDVKIYERLNAPGRAWLVHGIAAVADDAAALAALADPAFDPRGLAVVAEPLTPQPAAAAGPDESVTLVACKPERLMLRAQVSSPALLVVADSFYPGWEATVDAAPAPILRANLLFRGIALAPGEHEVVFSYRPAGWQSGGLISLAALALLACGLLATVFVPGRRGV